MVPLIQLRLPGGDSDRVLVSFLQHILPREEDCAIQSGEWRVETLSVPAGYYSLPVTQRRFRTNRFQYADRAKEKTHVFMANLRPSPPLPPSEPQTGYRPIMANMISAQTDTPRPVKPMKSWTAYLWSVSDPGSSLHPRTLTRLQGHMGQTPGGTQVVE